ncbi:MAG TPA: four helix bundle protein [Candidatus Acidoferrales bacterium]|nr:four helix bundle protein [Candidatus Acidoferrales bacterium]
MVFDNKRAPAETTPAIRDYKDLQVWQKGMELAKRVYRLTKNFPAEEKFGLVSQMRRAVVSIPSNLAEGHARNTTGEFVQFISHAQGSLAELDTQCRLSVTLGFCNDADTEPVSLLITELQKMLKGLRRKLGPSP